MNKDLAQQRDLAEQHDGWAPMDTEPGHRALSQGSEELLALLVAQGRTNANRCVTRVRGER